MPRSFPSYITKTINNLGNAILCTVKARITLSMHTTQTRHRHMDPSAQMHQRISTNTYMPQMNASGRKRFLLLCTITALLRVALL